MLAVLVVSLISSLIILIQLKAKRVWNLILKCNFACYVTLSKVKQQFKETQEVCGREIIEQNLVVIAELSATSSRGRKEIAEWILINMTEYALISDGLYAGCINVTFK